MLLHPFLLSLYPQGHAPNPLVSSSIEILATARTLRVPSQLYFPAYVDLHPHLPARKHFFFITVVFYCLFFIVLFLRFAKQIVFFSPTIIFFLIGLRSYSSLYLLDCLVHSKHSITILFIVVSFYSETAAWYGETFQSCYFRPLVKTHSWLNQAQRGIKQYKIVCIFLFLLSNLFVLYSLSLY